MRVGNKVSSMNNIIFAHTWDRLIELWLTVQVQHLVTSTTNVMSFSQNVVAILYCMYSPYKYTLDTISGSN